MGQRGKNILFVDDEQFILDGIKRMLRGMTSESTLFFALNGQEAVSLLASQSMDLVVTDVKMPMMDGFELMNEIISHPEWGSPDVIFMTGLRDDDLKRKALTLGAHDLLNKPLLKEDLIARIQSTAQLHFYKKELENTVDILKHQLMQAQKMELIGTLAAGAVHDLKNVLSGMIGYNELLLYEKALDHRVKKLLEQIKLSGESANQYLSQILNFSRRSKEKMTPLSVNEIITQCIQMIQPMIPKSVQVQRQVYHEACYVKGITTELYQIFMNLFMNAIHAMPDGGMLSINIEKDHPSVFDLKDSSFTGEVVRVQVQDTGSGIDPSIIDKIFEPSFTTKEISKGSGLGLAVVKYIVDLYHGQLEVESDPSIGTIFSVYLNAIE